MYLGPRILPIYTLPLAVRCPRPRRSLAFLATSRNLDKQSTIIDNSVPSAESANEDTFYVDEEPHMFSPQEAGGYSALNLGETLSIFSEGPTVPDRKFKIVRKLGRGRHSSVGTFCF